MSDALTLKTVVPRREQITYTLTVHSDRAICTVVRDGVGGIQSAEVYAQDVFEALWAWNEGPWVLPGRGRVR